MDLPTAVPQLLVVVVMALPGVVFAATRTRALGRPAVEASLSNRIAQGLVAALIFDAAYYLILGQRLVGWLHFDAEGPRSPFEFARTILLLGLAVPAVVSWLWHRGHRYVRPEEGRLLAFIVRTGNWRAARREWVRRYLGGWVPRYSPVPTAWDLVVPEKGGQFIRIETRDGKFVAGYFGPQSFVSTYPEPHDVYVELQYDVDKKGKILAPVVGSSGFWYAIQPGDTIEWLQVPTSPEASDG